MTSNFDAPTIQADFNRLALLSQEQWDHNSHYHKFLLRRLPAHYGDALEIGCGMGMFSRLLAERAEHVLGLDLSPQMLRIARERSRQYTNIDFQLADVLQWEFPSGRFDCIASIATLHHLPMEEMLLKMKGALREDGTLLVLDLFQGEGLSDVLASVLAVPVSSVLKFVHNGRVRPTQEERAAWNEHGQRDRYLTLDQVRRLCAAILPGAKVRRHLLWRYSIVWRKAENS